LWPFSPCHHLEEGNAVRKAVEMTERGATSSAMHGSHFEQDKTMMRHRSDFDSRELRFGVGV
jgi:hypothetical protein